MRATLVRRAGLPFPGLNKPNNVPKWQTLHQTHDGLRQWQKGPRAKLYLYPYWALMAFSCTATAWMMGRQVLGHKTWFSEG